MASFHNQVLMVGYPMQDFQLTARLVRPAAGVDLKTLHGRAVTLDDTADNQFRLADDGDYIDGRILVVEDRVNEGQLVASIAFKFAERMVIEDGAVVARGDTVVGAGEGRVRAALERDPRANRVVRVEGNLAHVLKF